MSMLDLAAFDATPLTHDPFDFLVVPNFVKPDRLHAINADFPPIEKYGSYPLDTLHGGPAFDELGKELLGHEVRAAFEKKFGIDLGDRPTTLTVRGHARMRDGQIHTDSKTKLITVLVYLNEQWSEPPPAGRLRILRSKNDLEDQVAEIEPAHGTLVAFRNGPNAWHGHHKFVGVRRSMQLNWVVNEGAVRRSSRLHHFSAFLKKWRGILSGSSKKD